MALAPSDFLLGVPSSSIIRRSNASCSAASIPRRRGAILLRTFSTAVRTPLPPYRALSPSRSSWASCSPVEAPEGTAARPTLPEDTVTSHSSVGLPRLSRISRAWTSTISVMAVLQPGSARVARASSRSKAARRQACDPTFAGGRSGAGAAHRHGAFRRGGPGAAPGHVHRGQRGEPPHRGRRQQDHVRGSQDRQPRYIVAANRESQRIALEGNTISIIDVDRIEAALADPTVKAEVARVRVGTNDPAGQTRPFIPSFTPNGKEIVVPNFRANNVSIVDLAKALAGDPGAEVARIPLTRPADADNVVRPSRPKGSAVTSDGRYAVISGGGRTTFVPSGTVWVIDLRTRGVVGTVTGVGNDPYGPGRARRRLRRQRPRSSASTIATSQLPGGSSWASSHASASGTYAGAYAVAVTTTVQARLGPGPRPPSSNKPSWSVLAARSCWPGHLSATPAPRTAPASAPRTCPCTLQAGSHAAAPHNASKAKRRPIDPSTREMPERSLPLPRPGRFRLSCGTVPRLPLPPCAGAGRERPFRGRLSWRVFWKARSRSSPERAAASAASTRSPSRARGRRSWSTTSAPTATAGARAARWPTRRSRTSRRPAAKPAPTTTASPRARALTASCGPRSTSMGASTCW